jgi:hypothetical protein
MVPSVHFFQKNNLDFFQKTNQAGGVFSRILAKYTAVDTNLKHGTATEEWSRHGDLMGIRSRF